MMRFNRPAAPAKFAKRVSDAVRDGIADDCEIWREFKDDLSKAQYGRCGYCDSSIAATSYGDVEHYRPKNSLDIINDPRAAEKCERNEPPKVQQAKGTSGYHWLRLEWSNYLYACQICNQRFKRCLFPVKEGTRTLPLDPLTAKNEEPLLLWCYGKEDPVEHLEFREDGAICAKNNSSQGHATILTCGLSREHLRDLRAEKLSMAKEIIASLEEATANKNAAFFADCIEKLKQRGAEDRSFAGVFRIFVMQELGATNWNDVLTLKL